MMVEGVLHNQQPNIIKREELNFLSFFFSNSLKNTQPNQIKYKYSSYLNT